MTTGWQRGEAPYKNSKFEVHCRCTAPRCGRAMYRPALAGLVLWCMSCKPQRRTRHCTAVVRRAAAAPCKPPPGASTQRRVEGARRPPLLHLLGGSSAACIDPMAWQGRSEPAGVLQPSHAPLRPVAHLPHQAAWAADQGNGPFPVPPLSSATPPVSLRLLPPTPACAELHKSMHAAQCFGRSSRTRRCCPSSPTCTRPSQSESWRRHASCMGHEPYASMHGHFTPHHHHHALAAATMTALLACLALADTQLAHRGVGMHACR